MTGQADAPPDDDTELLVGIPAYNECEAIGTVVREALTVADSVVVVDDGSADETAAVARAAGATVIEHERNSGYGAALTSVFTYAADRGVSTVVTLDGDGQHDPADVSSLLTHHRNHGHDVVIGSRFLPTSSGSVPVARTVGIKIVNLLTNIMLRSISGSTLTDAQSGFRLYNRQAVELLANADGVGDGMESSTDILFICASAGLSIGEAGISIDYDVTEPNTHDPVSHGFVLLRNFGRFVDTEYLMSPHVGVGLVMVLFGLGVWYLLDTPPNSLLYDLTPSVATAVLLGVAYTLLRARRVNNQR